MAAGLGDLGRGADGSGPGSDEYRSLSALALASFAIGVGCTCLLALGALVSLTRASTLFLPGNYMVLVVIPLVGFFLGFLSIVRIRNSDGLLSGGSLARTGLILSVLSIILYGAYHGGMSLALRMRTDAFVQKWFTLLANGKDEMIDEAFIFTLSPESRPNLAQERSNLRAMLEIDHNSSSDMVMSGPYTTFLTSPIVRLVRQSGDKVTFTLDSCSEPMIVDNGFQMDIDYKVTTTLANFNVQMQIHGASSNIPDIRKWHIKGARIRAPDGSQNPDFTPEGVKYIKRTVLARNLLHEFSSRIGPQRDFDKSFQLTASGEIRPSTPGGPLDAYQKKRDAFFHIESAKAPSPPQRIGRLDPVRFWSNVDLKAPFVDALDLCFSPATQGPPNSTWINPQQETYPMTSVKDGMLEMRLDCKLTLMPVFGAQVEAVLVAPLAQADQSSAWKLSGFDIISARPLQVPPEMRNATPEMLYKGLRKSK